MYYAKARFYDPAVQRFLAVDPAKDGQNWYAYVNGNPLKYVDPLGMWGSDVHHSGTVTIEDVEYEYGTKYWAIESGLSEKHALIVADANQSVDNWNTSAVFMPGRHFNRNLENDKEDSRILWAQERYDNAIKLWDKNKQEEALKELGRALHAIQDIDAHLQYKVKHLDIKGPLLHTSYAWIDGELVGNTSYFDDIDYHIYKNKDGIYRHVYVGMDNNPRYMNTYEVTLLWITRFMNDTGYMSRLEGCE